MKALAAVLALGVALVVGGSARAEYPERSIRIVAPAAAGGPTFITTRLLADKMQQTLGQTIVVEPVGGAGGNVGAATVARAEPDGYTLLMATIGTHAINRTLYGQLSFDPVRDFAPISLIVQYPLVLVVHPSVPAKSVRELIDYAKANPGKLNRASGGTGTSMHLSGELFRSQAGVDMPHVPYKGSAPALNDLIGNHVQVMFDSLVTALPLIQAGNLRALAITGTSRSPILPDVPTVAEAGLPGYSASGWIGLVAPAGTPPAVVAKLQRAAAEALKSPDLREKLLAQAAEPVGSTPEEFARFIQDEAEKWGRAVREAGVKVE